MPGSLLSMPSTCSGYFCVDMTIGAVILGLWQWFAPADALISAPLVASALIAGDGVWTVPSAILALAKVTPPMCAQVYLSPDSYIKFHAFKVFVVFHQLELSQQSCITGSQHALSASLQHRSIEYGRGEINFKCSIDGLIAG